MKMAMPCPLALAWALLPARAEPPGEPPAEPPGEPAAEPAPVEDEAALAADEAALAAWASCDAGEVARCEEMVVALTPVAWATHFGDPATEDPRATAAGRRACESDRALACHRLGVRLRFGLGTPIDLPAAVSAFERACDLGAPIGCTSLAWHLDHGVGVPADPARAVALLEQACADEGGSSSAGQLACGQLTARPWLSLLDRWLGGGG